jgi:hypothetical protein
MPPSRRQFLAAVPVLAAAPTVLAQQQHAHSDAILDAVVAEFGRLLKEAAPGGEFARRAATLFRLQAAHLRAQQFDRQLQTAVRRQSIEAIIVAATSPQAVQRRRDELAAQGIRLDAPDPSTYISGAALQQIAEGRVRYTDLLTVVASALDSLAVRLASTEVAPGVYARPIQQGDCSIVRDQLSNLANVAAAVCAISSFDPLLAPACLAATATYLAWYYAARNVHCV